MKLLLGTWNSSKEFEEAASELIEHMLIIEPFPEIFDLTGRFSYRTGTNSFNELVRKLKNQTSPEKERVVAFTEQMFTYQGTLRFTPEIMMWAGRTSRTFLSADSKGNAYYKGDDEVHSVKSSSDYGIAAVSPYVMNEDFKYALRVSALALAGTLDLAGKHGKNCLAANMEKYRLMFCENCQKEMKNFKSPKTIPENVQLVY